MRPVAFALALRDLAVAAICCAGCGPAPSVVGTRASPQAAQGTAASGCKVVVSRLSQRPGAVEPTVALAGEAVVAAWTEVGEADALRVTRLQPHGDGLVGDSSRDAAAGWEGLGTAQLAALDGGGAVVAWSGRDASGREGIGRALVDGAGALGPPARVIEAPGARLGAIADAGRNLLYGWWQWDADERVVRLSVERARSGRAESAATLGPASVSPAMQLVPATGDRAVYAIYTAYAKRDPEAPELVWLADLDDGGRLRGAPRALAEGSSPSLALLPGGPLVEWERPSDSRTFFGRPTASSAWVEGTHGAVAPALGGALLCNARGESHAHARVDCARLDAAGRIGGEIPLARATGVRAIGIAGTARYAAVVWQADDDALGSAVSLATITCR